MSFKVWEVKEGKVTSVMHANAKDENRLVTLKQPMDYDSSFLSELDKVIDFANTYILSVVKIDKIGNGKEDETVKSENSSKNKTLTIIEESDTREESESKEGSEELKEEQEKRHYITTEKLCGRLEREFKPGIPFNAKDIKAVGKFSKIKDVYYHLSKLIDKGVIIKLDIDEGKEQSYTFKEGPKELISKDKVAGYHKDLYAR
jgi:hypothetical protein